MTVKIFVFKINSRSNFYKTNKYIKLLLSVLDFKINNELHDDENVVNSIFILNKRQIPRVFMQTPSRLH